MTRVTNFGRKRTYLESTLPHEQPAEDVSLSTGIVEPPKENSKETDEQPPKKKRKRTKKSQRTNNMTNEDGTTIEGRAEAGSSSSQKPQSDQTQKKKTKKDKNRKGRPIDKDAAVRSESRRVKRIAARNADTTCFACREKGHAARDCPKEARDKGKKSVGICYRCGSTKHNLSRCKKPSDPLDPMPFATCFVCEGKGHLASACEKNKDKGVYPNGGSCKLCGDTTHLAKDCAVRRKDTNAATQVMGMERNVGADEDDFHAIGRMKQELDKEDRKVEKIQKTLDVRVGAQSGAVKVNGKAPVKAKVVHF
ncbi:hypothetical protein V5O48_002654 [Marasmius crinis-equi]|uniref:CCHC-type domain-containing protein n=1 Tax=Marasmius crinis-equi TaxID=585013 RepID=A0ABR3FV52_9AGAR